MNTIIIISNISTSWIIATYNIFKKLSSLFSSQCIFIINSFFCTDNGKIVHSHIHFAPISATSFFKYDFAPISLPIPPMGFLCCPDNIGAKSHAFQTGLELWPKCIKINHPNQTWNTPQWIKFTTHYKLNMIEKIMINQNAYIVVELKSEGERFWVLPSLSI